MFKTLITILFFSTMSLASNHGLYLKVVENIKGSFSQSVQTIESALTQSDFKLLKSYPISSPAILGDACPFKAHLFLVEDSAFTNLLTHYGNKYLIAAFIKIGLYQDEHGTQLVLADPETINRIVFNDLPDNQYQQIINQTLPFKSKLVRFLQSLNLGNNVAKTMKPIRSDEALRKADKDMFMMVGPMTFFRDEDQFPIIFKKKANTPAELDEFLAFVKQNLAHFSPSKKDWGYQEVNDPFLLKWQIIGQIQAPDGEAIVLGLSRPRTEALSFKIAGQSRASKTNPCPGIDHLCAYPIEVLITFSNNEIKVRTAREMFRMDMYFWDAGKMAFMKYMNMPGMLDQSIKKALLGTED